MKTTISASNAMLVTSMAAGIFLALVTYDTIKKNRRKTDRKGGRDSKSSRSCQDELNLPAHLERDRLKERRWQRMMPKLAMKKPLYDNILMKDPDGAILCSVSQKKANWYVGKKLAIWETKPAENGVATSDKPSIRLLFVPRGSSANATPATVSASVTRQTTKDTDESLHIRKNRCVICGRDDPTAFYMRHSIVPYCLRTLFPAEFKTHLPHDIVMLCAMTCHVPAGKYANERIHELEEELWHGSKPPEKYIVDADVRRIKTAATTLLRRRSKLPEERIQELERIVIDYYREASSSDTIDAAGELSESLLVQASQLSDRVPNPDYKTSAELIMEYLSNQEIKCFEDALTAFIREWRRHFVQTMQPGYLPHGWSIDSPVKCDDRS